MTTRLVIVGGYPTKWAVGKLVDTWVRDIADEYNNLRAEEVLYLSGSATEGLSLHTSLATINPDYALVVGPVALSHFWKNIRLDDIRGKWWGMPLVGGRFIPAMAIHDFATILGGDRKATLQTKMDLRQIKFAMWGKARGAYEIPVCFVCEGARLRGEGGTGMGDLENDRWLACDLGLGRDVTEEKGPPVSLCVCRKHYTLHLKMKVPGVSGSGKVRLPKVNLQQGEMFT